MRVTFLSVLLSMAAACGSEQQPASGSAGSPDQAATAGAVKLEETTLQLARDEPYAAERGHLTVPENRSDPSSDFIEIGFLRLKSTSESTAAPIFVLPGGPGSSWVTEIEAAAGDDEASAGKRLLFQQHFFEDLRSVADVVIVDQRGAGTSRPYLECDDGSSIPNRTPISAESYRDAAERFTENCLQELEGSGRDVRGYSVFELVEDVDALRRALGYDRISLFAGSFGSQWGLSFIRRHEGSVDRFVFWGLEGLDHAYDSPTGVLEALAAVYDDTSAASGDNAGQPAFRDLLESSLARLEQEPATLSLAGSDENDGASLHFGPAGLQRALYGTGDFSVRDRLSIASWHAYTSELLSGDYSRAAPIVRDARRINEPGEPVPQYLSIDCGLAVSETRRAVLERDPARELVGNVNLEYDVICAEWPAIDVGDEFRKSKVSNVPGLLIHGTWDVSTPFENAVEVSRLFPNADLVVVEKATHRVLRELYRERGETLRPLLRQFLEGRPVRPPKRIELPGINTSRRGASIFPPQGGHAPRQPE